MLCTQKNEATLAPLVKISKAGLKSGNRVSSIEKKVETEVSTVVKAYKTVRN
jgi:hypothetical protein